MGQSTNVIFLNLVPCSRGHVSLPLKCVLQHYKIHVHKSMDKEEGIALDANTKARAQYAKNVVALMDKHALLETKDNMET